MLTGSWILECGSEVGKYAYRPHVPYRIPCTLHLLQPFFLIFVYLLEGR